MLGARIAALRRHAGLSQSELAEQLQISASAMGMYEQGRREPSMDTIVTLARLFQVSTDYLLTGQPSLQERSRLEAILLERIDAAQTHLESRRNSSFSRQELATLFAAVLLEP